MGQKSVQRLTAVLVSVCKFALVCGVARIVNQWEPCFPRNKNENFPNFWIVCGINLVGSVVILVTMDGKRARSVRQPSEVQKASKMLSRQQTDEWRGWMQLAWEEKIQVCLFILSVSHPTLITSCVCVLCCVGAYEQKGALWSVVGRA